ncbi:MAG: VOC family protein [Candidatus Dormibacteraeota bacterium]|nr:VOC family protein [Candidatus Dormibacteraeota bacterium]
MTSDREVPVSGVCELVLEQNDLAAAEHFYADVLGFPVVERWRARGEAVWVMAGDRTRIGLWGPQIGLGGGRGGVHVHYAMGLPADAYEALLERLRSRGYTVLDHDHSKYAHGRGRAAYVTDPGGHVVEFWTWDVAGHLQELAAGESPGSH